MAEASGGSSYTLASSAGGSGALELYPARGTCVTNPLPAPPLAAVPDVPVLQGPG